MKQFLKNIAAMLYLAIILPLLGGILSQIFALGVALPLVWLIIIGIFFSASLLAIVTGLSAAIFPAIKLVHNSISGKVLCTITCIGMTYFNIMSMVKMVMEYNANNVDKHVTFLVLQIIASVFFIYYIIATILALWNEEL